MQKKEFIAELQGEIGNRRALTAQVSYMLKQCGGVYWVHELYILNAKTYSSVVTVKRFLPAMLLIREFWFIDKKWIIQQIVLKFAHKTNLFY